MSHIAEGLFHAYLDGALGPEEQFMWTDATRHLEVCADCRRRLDEAREVREAASGLLAGATMEPVPRPGFDALIAEAAARRETADATVASIGAATTGSPRVAERPRNATRNWWSSPMKLAWAASLVLAVGAGWISRQVMVEQGESLPGLVAEGDLASTGGSDEDAAFRSRPEAARAFEEHARPAAPDADVEREGFSDRAAGNEPAAVPGERQALPQAPPEALARDRVTDEVGELEVREQQRRAAEADDDVPAGTDTESAADVALGGQALAPQAFAAKSAEASSVCYVPTSDRRESAGAAAEEEAPAAEAEADPNQVPAPLRPGRLRLEPDGTATLQVEGRPMVGFWSPTDSGGRTLRLTDGETWWELDLTAQDGRLRGNLVAPVGPTDPAIAGNRAVGDLHFVEGACP